jgi:phosphoglycolate phosphatase
MYLFDIDGTLLRAGGAGARALNAVFARLHGLDEGMRGIDAGGRTDPWLVEQVFVGRLGRAPTEREIDEVLDAYLPELERELAAAASFRVLPWVEETLGWLRGIGGCAIGIATGNTEAGAHRKLARAGLVEHFAFGGYGCDSADRARVVATAIERGGACARDRIVVVGDTEHDVAAARACGVRVVAVATGSATRETLDATGADAVIDDLSGLRAWHEDVLG